jgi:SAM-dependent methyltransferase
VIAPVGDYPLQRDAVEHRRLAVQSEFWAADAEALFRSAELQPGSRVADIGCGTTHLAIELARHVGPRGRVYALDSDRALLDAIATESLPASLQLVHGDAYALPWADESLDAIHARFVAAPCGRADALLAEMRRVLRPGGLLMLQEPDADSWQVPMGLAWPRLRGLIRAGFAQRGGDFDVGRSVGRCVSAALVDVRERRVRHTIAGAHPYASLPLAFAEGLGRTWRQAGLTDDAEMDELERAVRKALTRATSRVTTFTLVQFWGRKLVADCPKPKRTEP